MREIPLTNHPLPALVDDDIFELATAYQWRLRGNLGDRCGYVVPTAGGPLLYLHHLVIKPPPGMVVDHRNGDPLDNTRQNLRVATLRQNAWNRAAQRGRSSEYCGVVKTGESYCASIKIGPVRYHLGVFGDERDAAMAVDRVALACRGEYARLNLPVPGPYPLVYPSQRLGRSRTRTGYWGVHEEPVTGWWIAAIDVAGVPKALGLFPSPEGAARAYDAAARLAPDARRLNFP